MDGQPSRLLFTGLEPPRPRPVPHRVDRLREGCRSAGCYGRGAPFTGAGRGSRRGWNAEFEDRAQARCCGTPIGEHGASLAAAPHQATGYRPERRRYHALAGECGGYGSGKTPSSCPSPQGEKGRSNFLSLWGKDRSLVSPRRKGLSFISLCSRGEGYSLSPRGKGRSFCSLSPRGEGWGEGGLRAGTRPSALAARS